MNTIFTIGIFLCFFLQFLLLSKKEKSTADKVLSMWMFIFGINLFLSYVIYPLGYKSTYPFLVGIDNPIPLLHGPMLYLYIIYSLRPNHEFNWKVYIHFVPALLSWLLLTDFIFFYTAEEQLMVIRGEVNNYSTFFNFSIFAIITSGIVYPIYSYFLVNKHQNLINTNFSYEESINLNWLRYCIWGIGFIYLVVAILFLMNNLVDMETEFNTDMIVYSLVVLFIFFLGYFGIKHQNIFYGEITIDRLAEPKSTGEYKNSGLKQKDAVLYHQKLLELMGQKKPFLEPKLTLSYLADELDLSVNHLSQVINQYEERNFFDFVNSYRVEEFKKRALDPANSNYSILAIALDSGFNSKSSFNQVFKKLSGKTPSQFMAE
ncbi:MAG: helix-turn-helix domain-containing protein [Balneolaceae bacterium]